MLTLWLEQDADALKAVDLARRAAAEWHKHGRRDAWLNHTTERLTLVESLLERPDLDRLLGEEGRAYIRACRARDDAEVAERLAQAEQRREDERRIQEAEQAAERDRLKAAETEAASARRLFRRTLLGAGVAVVLMIAAVAFGIQARTQRREAERALGTSNVTEASRKLAAGLVPEAVAHLAEAVRLVPDETVWRAALISELIDNRWGRITADIATAETATGAVFSPDGTRLIVVSGDEARLWNPMTGAAIGKPMRHRNLVRDARFSTDGALIVTGSQDRTARVWNGLTGEPMHEPIRHDSAVTRVAFSPSGRYVVTLAGGAVRVSHRDAPGAAVAVPDEPQWQPRAAVSDDVERRCSSGDVRVATDGNAVVLSRAGETGAIATIDHSSPVSAVRFALDCRTAISMAGREARAWDTGGTAIAQPLIHSSPVTGAHFSPDGRFVATVFAEGARVWDLRAGDALSRLLRYPESHLEIDFSDDGERVVTAAEREVRVWNGQTGAAIGDPIAVEGRVSDLLLSGDGERLLVAGTVEAAVYRAGTNQRIGRAWRVAPDEYADAVLPVMSPDWSVLVTRTDKSARIWEVDSGERRGKLLVHRQPITDVAFSRDGSRIVTASEDATARVWSATTGEPIGGPLRHDQSVRSARFSADGSTIVTVFDRLIVEGGESRAYPREVQAWDAGTGEAIGAAISHDEDVTAVALSPNGTRLLTATGGIVRLWDPRSAARVENPIDFADDVTGVTYSADGSRILIVAGDTAHLYDAERLVGIGRPAKAPGLIVRAGFTPDQQQLLIVSEKKRGDDAEAAEAADAGNHRVAALWDAPTGTGADVPLLTRVAEIVSGYRITALGALEAATGRVSAAQSILQGAVTEPPSVAQRIARWLLSDPASRATSPLAAAGSREDEKERRDVRR
jgi:WD40 repeat protein